MLEFKLRPAAERGAMEIDWLTSIHSFSFADYHDPKHMGFGNLRVINDDQIAVGKGFGMHPHQNIEIFSYILDGNLEHKDSMGNGSTVSAGGIQYMSAGTGVSHSEFNPSDTELVKFLQIWLHPTEHNTTPHYATTDLDAADKDGQLKLFLSSDGRDDSIKTLADTSIYAATLNGSQTISYTHKQPRVGWIQMARGSLTVNDQVLQHGDGLAIEGDGELVFSAGENAEFILFDLAAG